jgi:hypothetical protein
MWRSFPSWLQSLIIFCVLPDAIRVPSGLKLTLLTVPLCPLRLRLRVPFLFQRMIVLSALPEAIIFPSGLKLTLQTGAVCP